MKTVCPKGRMGSNPILSAIRYREGREVRRYRRQLNIGGYLISDFWRSTQEAEGTPLERVQVVNSGARVQIPPSPFTDTVIDTSVSVTVFVLLHIAKLNRPTL